MSYPPLSLEFGSYRGGLGSTIDEAHEFDVSTRSTRLVEEVDPLSRRRQQRVAWQKAVSTAPNGKVTAAEIVQPGAS